MDLLRVASALGNHDATLLLSTLLRHNLHADDVTHSSERLQEVSYLNPSQPYVTNESSDDVIRNVMLQSYDVLLWGALSGHRLCSMALASRHAHGDSAPKHLGIAYRT